MKYFVYDPENCGFESFETMEERDKAAEEMIWSYLQDGWGDGVNHIVAGEVTHNTVQVDRRERPDDDELDVDDCDSEGTYWDADWDYICRYELAPIHGE